MAASLLFWVGRNQPAKTSKVMASMSKVVLATNMLALAMVRPRGCITAPQKAERHTNSKLPRSQK